MSDLSYKTRRRLSVLILLVGLPVYIIAVVNLMTWLPRLPFLVELLIYIALGVVWAFPLKFVFKGIGKEDPEA